MKFNQLVDDAAEKFEVAQAVNFAYLANEAQLQAQFSQLQGRYNNYFNKLGKKYQRKKIHTSPFDWRDLVNATI